RRSADPRSASPRPSPRRGVRRRRRGRGPARREGRERLPSVTYSDAAVSRVRSMSSDEARTRIQKLLVTGDNRLKQGVSAAKARESYEQALAVAREAGL